VVSGLRDLLVFRPALRSPEIKTCRLGSAEGSSRPVGLSTCAAYFRKSKPVVVALARVVVRLIWSVQTLDDAAMTANVRCSRPAPVPSLAGIAGCSSATCDASNGAAGEPSKSPEPIPRTQRRPPDTFRRLTTCRGSSTTKSAADDPQQSQNDRFWLREYATQVARPTGREEPSPRYGRGGDRRAHSEG
jgi:hypothetical protein